MANIFDNLFPENLYHSYIVEGDPDITPIDLRVYLESRGDIKAQSLDVICQIYDAFTITDSEKIKDWHSERGITDGKKVCIIGAKFINHDAERTLLKMIEEPSANTHFFIIVPNSLMLLDTIISRAHVVKINKEANPVTIKSASEFLDSTPKVRIELVAKLIDTHKESLGSGSVRFSAISLINALEQIIYKKFQSDKTNTEIQFSLSELNSARDYLSLPGASVKMILEHIALVL
jgi:DNA polymerase III delta prime subunit